MHQKICGFGYNLLKTIYIKAIKIFQKEEYQANILYKRAIYGDRPYVNRKNFELLAKLEELNKFTCLHKQELLYFESFYENVLELFIFVPEEKSSEKISDSSEELSDSIANDSPDSEPD